MFDGDVGLAYGQNFKLGPSKITGDFAWNIVYSRGQYPPTQLFVFGPFFFLTKLEIGEKQQRLRCRLGRVDRILFQMFAKT